MAKINPAFQAAPFFGQSSFDPNEFMRRHNMEKFQLIRHNQEQQDRDTARGLENLMVDVKGWADQGGFKEIADDQKRIMNGYMDLSKKGMNLVSPKTTDEILAYKAISDAHNKLKQKVDTWAQEKEIYDSHIKAIQAQAKLPEEERTIDVNSSIANLDKSLKSGDILSKFDSLQQSPIVTIDRPVDVVDEITKSRSFYHPTTITKYIDKDPVTGEQVIKEREEISPAHMKENLRRAGIRYENTTPSFKKAVKQLRERDPDPDSELMSDKEYYVSIATPLYKEKYGEKPVGRGGGGGIGINFLGQKTTMNPGVARKEPLNFGDRTYTNIYQFDNTKPVTIPIGASGTTQFAGDTWEPVEGGGTVEGTLDFVDMKEKEFIFKTTKKSDTPYVESGSTIAVPFSVIGDQASELPIIVNGKKTTLKELMGTQPVSQIKTIKGIDFSKGAPLKNVPAYSGKAPKGKYDNE